MFLHKQWRQFIFRNKWSGCGLRAAPEIHLKDFQRFARWGRLRTAASPRRHHHHHHSWLQHRGQEPAAPIIAPCPVPVTEALTSAPNPGGGCRGDPEQGRGKHVAKHMFPNALIRRWASDMKDAGICDYGLKINLAFNFSFSSDGWPTEHQHDIWHWPHLRHTEEVVNNSLTVLQAQHSLLDVSTAWGTKPYF